MQLTPQPSPPEAEGEATFLPAVAVELLSQVPQRAATSALLGALRPSPWAHTVLLPVAPQHPGNAQQCAQLLASPPHWGRPPAGTHSLSHRSSPARLQHILGASGLVVLVGWAAGPQAQQDEAGQRVGCSHLGGHREGERWQSAQHPWGCQGLPSMEHLFHGASDPGSIPFMEHSLYGAFPLLSIPRYRASLLCTSIALGQIPMYVLQHPSSSQNTPPAALQTLTQLFSLHLFSS